MSALVQCHNLSFRYDELKKDLLSDVTCNFHQGWTSICGPNGCGKTTLLRLINQNLQPQSGNIQVKGKVVSVPQSTEFPPSNIAFFRSNYEGMTVRIRQRLGIDEDWYDRWDTLSIGERKRLQLASALSEDPNVLLVDEPTNHVDADTRTSILETLQRFKGVGILISHDRLLLNQLCTHTGFLEMGRLRIISAPYDSAAKELGSMKRALSDSKEKLRKEKGKTARAVQSQVEKIDRGKSKLSKRGIDKKDHDAKEKVNLAKLTGADLADSRKKQVFQRKHDRLSEEMSRIHIQKTYDLGVFFENTPRVRDIHFEAEEVSFGFLEISIPEIILRANDKLAITGPNGSGKSTLMQHWLQRFSQPIAYAPQEFSNEEAKKITEDLLTMNKETQGKVMTLISCFGSDPKSLAVGAIPSPGVWQKIMIALAIINAVPVLILDEPTNHMDLQAIEVLEDALSHYKGILVCISHDETFVTAVCSQRLELHKTQRRSIGKHSYISSG